MDRKGVPSRSCSRPVTSFLLTRPIFRRAPTAHCVKWLSLNWTKLSADMFESFSDRKEAGQHLGRELKRTLPTLLQQAHPQQPGQPQQEPTTALPADFRLEEVVVLGLVRGGMPVADAVADALNCPCDAFVVRKVGAPSQPEFGIGAIAEGGHVIINEAAVESVGATKQQLQDTIDRETTELQRRVQEYRGGRSHLPVSGKVVVLVDDGLATGVTARAACAAMKASKAAAVVLAVPVGSEHTVAELQQQHVADVVVCLRTPKRFRAVGAHYLDFDQTTDEEVVAILQHHPHPDTKHMPAHTTDAVPAGTAAAAAAPEAGLAQPAASHHDAAAANAAADTGSKGPDFAKSPAPAAAGSRCVAVDTAAVTDQSAVHAPHAPATPTQVSSLAAALHRSPAVSPSAAAAAAAAAGFRSVAEEEIVITDSELGVQLHGSLTVPQGARGLVVFAHGSGSGSSRNSPRNRQVAATLNRAGLATLLFDLLSDDEAQQHHNVFDIALLASRLQLAVEWLEAEGAQLAGKCPPDFPLCLFGASTGGGAALWAAAYMGPRISAVVVRGGRPDLAAAKLPAVTAPTLLLVGGEDTHVLQYNSTALQMMGASDSSQIVVVPGAGHLFEGPGQLEAVAELAVQWFRSHMGTDGNE